MTLKRSVQIHNKYFEEVVKNYFFLRSSLSGVKWVHLLLQNTVSASFSGF